MIIPIPHERAHQIVSTWRERYSRVAMKLIPAWVYEGLENEIALTLAEQNCEIALQAGDPMIHRCGCAGSEVPAK